MQPREEVTRGNAPPMQQVPTVSYLICHLSGYYLMSYFIVALSHLARPGLAEEGRGDATAAGSFLLSWPCPLPFPILGVAEEKCPEWLQISPKSPSQKPGPWSLFLALLMECWGLCGCTPSYGLSQKIAGGRR